MKDPLNVTRLDGPPTQNTGYALEDAQTTKMQS